MEINLLDDSQLVLLQQLTADASSVVVTVHKSPDGDAVGSMLAWAQYLQTLGKEVACVIPDAAPDFLMWLPGSQTLLRYDKHPDRAKEAFDKADLVCCLDYNDLSRTGDMADVIAQSKAPDSSSTTMWARPSRRRSRCLIPRCRARRNSSSACCGSWAPTTR